MNSGAGVMFFFLLIVIHLRNFDLTSKPTLLSLKTSWVDNVFDKSCAKKEMVFKPKRVSSYTLKANTNLPKTLEIMCKKSQ